MALLWGVAEGTLFFIVPDVIISLVAMRMGLRAGAVAAVLAAVGAMIGGSVLYGFAAKDPAATLAVVEAVPAVSPAMVTAARADMDASGWFLAALKGPLTSTPYKVYTALAAGRDVGPLAWAAAAIPIRLPRFLLVAACFALVGRLVRGHVSPRFGLGAFTLGWVLFYGWFWLSHPG